MSIKVYGAKEIQAALDAITRNIQNKKLITEPLAKDMDSVVHVVTGYLKSTIAYNDEIAYADADYAGYEADRGGDHDYAQRAIDDFNVNDYIDKLVEPY